MMIAKDKTAQTDLSAMNRGAASYAMESKSWVFNEARKLLARLEKSGAGDRASVLFETGYGPSGLPHIGTFGEVARTNWIRHAFSILEPSIPTRLICFSDDMDGLRKVPSNLPQQAMLAAHLDKPLTSVPDPFGTHESFAAHNNARLCAFLDQFGFDYEFISATAHYKSGRMDETLLKMLAHYDEVMAIILPTLGEARQKTYNPFLPICPYSGKVLMVALTSLDKTKGTINYMHPERGEEITTAVTGGACKLQWKADWAMRWVALGVDYEMAGKDLDESVKLSARICKAIGGRPPEGLRYELFLDENGEKISKSRGNGLTIEEWLNYAPPASLSYYMYQSPRKAKRLYFDVIPKHMDDYLLALEKYQTQDETARLDNPVWHIHNGAPPQASLPISFALLLNLVSVSHAENKNVLWGFIRNYAPTATPQTHPELDALAAYAVAYYHDFVKPHKTYRPPTNIERQAMETLLQQFATLPKNADAAAIQTMLYAIGKQYFPDALQDWFKALYQTLLGQNQGPRFGSFIAIYGIDETTALIRAALDGKLTQTQTET